MTKIPDREKLFALVAELGNVAEACRRLGLDRSAYYRWKKHKMPRKETGVLVPGTEKRLLELCLQYPEWGCDRLAYYLTLTGNRVSSPTAQKILIRHGLGRMNQRKAAAKKLDEGG